MVQVSVTSSVKIAGGPTLPLGKTFDPEAYTFATVTLDAAGGDGASQTVALLPTGDAVVLLAIRSRTAKGKPAKVTMTPMNDPHAGSDLSVDGVLLVQDAGVVKALVNDGPRSLVLHNTEAEPVSVEVLTCLDPDRAG